MINTTRRQLFGLAASAPVLLTQAKEAIAQRLVGGGAAASGTWYHAKAWENGTITDVIDFAPGPDPSSGVQRNIAKMLYELKTAGEERRRDKEISKQRIAKQGYDLDLAPLNSVSEVARYSMQLKRNIESMKRERVNDLERELANMIKRNGVPESMVDSIRDTVGSMTEFLWDEFDHPSAETLADEQQFKLHAENRVANVG